MSTIPDPHTGKQVKPWHQGTGGNATAFSRAEAQSFARQIVESETYRESIKERVQKGTLQPVIEQMLWFYAYGKPTEQVHVTVAAGQEDLSQLPLEELQKRARAYSDALDEAIELERALPGQVVNGPWKP